ncbi:protocatechuate 3,4-dioxygenase alpha subunit [Crossiella equi]|uniref:Protocatechuate 3,4-dioxygenase alpha subunit n=1 Tax=Crossiella equi TaxID=130796 RepID=A0ABS5A530_9PSEU|nr:protocatechuate 3,4-dioxygenase subunit alpha [Crossiella equi]MBP2471690.1 protocatechuate 3,4-dioxygenase alpha subunit [Crossiella equi]
MSTPSQTVGPYLSLGLFWPDGPDVVPEGTPGALWLSGTVYDGAGQPVPDAVIETWQADPDGHFDHPADPARRATPGFRAFGRSCTDADGHYGIRTLLPGAIEGQAPHVNVSVLARGLLHRVVTRIYFPEHARAHRDDPVWQSVPPERRATLLAERTADGYRFDVRLQGGQETVFFDV